MDLIVYGINYKTAPVEVRERFALSRDEILEILPQLGDRDGVAECAVLSTCNRTELYVACTDGFSTAEIASAFHQYRPARVGEQEKSFYRLKNLEAVRHIFRVAAGLESQMVGENQILGQVKDAYKIGCEARTNGAHLNRLFHMAFRVGKAVRSKTGLATGAVSISSAAVELAGHIFETLEDKSALIIGAGETGELVAKNLIDRDIASVRIANRSAERAQELAKSCAGRVVAFDNLAEEFCASDVVISATSSPDHVLTREMIEPFAKDNPSKKIVAIDIAIPRDIDAAIAELNNIFAYDMDDLKTVVEKNMAERKREIPRAEKIVARMVGEYETWLKGRKVVPTIKFLNDRFENIRVEELEKSKNCGTCSKRAEMDHLTKRIIKKILRTPIEKLLNDTDCTEEELEYLRELFA